MSHSLTTSPQSGPFHETPLHSSQLGEDRVLKPAPVCLPKIWLWKGVPKNQEGPLDGQAHPLQGRDLDSLREEARGTQAGVPKVAAGPATTTATRRRRLALIWGVGRRGRDTDDGSHEVPAVAVQVKAVMGLGIEA